MKGQDMHFLDLNKDVKRKWKKIIYQGNNITTLITSEAIKSKSSYFGCMKSPIYDNLLQPATIPCK